MTIQLRLYMSLDLTEFTNQVPPKKSGASKYRCDMPGDGMTTGRTIGNGRATGLREDSQVRI